MDDLKPCPFCGGDASHAIDHTTEGAGFVLCTSCGVTVEDWNEQGSCVAAWNTRTAPKVKPLEWSFRNEPNEKCIAADCSWGRYKIVDRGEYGLGVYSPRSGPTMGYYDNLEAAKAAAQADYDRRILSALEDTQ